MSKSLVVTFGVPSQKLESSSRLCDEYGSASNLNIGKILYYINDSPMMVQPDLLVDSSSNHIVGLTFELTSPDWMYGKCQKMLQDLDSNVIRLSNFRSELADREDGYIGLEVIWGNAESSARLFAQLDFGLWAFLYPRPNPSLFQDGPAWTPPGGLVIGSLEQLCLPVSITNAESGEQILKLASSGNN